MTAPNRQTGAPPPGEREGPEELAATVDAIRATVQAGGRQAQGSVVESKSEHTDARIVIAFEPDQTPPLPIGRPVDVTFSGGAVETGCAVSGRVVGRTETTRAVLYEMFFPRAANRALSPLINRRGALRVRPALAAPIAVQLRAFDGGVVEALNANDLSASGVSILVSPIVEQRLAATQRVELTLALPGDPVARSLGGRIFRRRLIGAHVHYGIRFEEQGTETEREAVLQWVLARHRALLGRSTTIAKSGRRNAA